MGVLACSGNLGPKLETGPWRAWLDCPGGRLPFELAITREHGKLTGSIRNGEETVEVPETYWDGGEMVFDFPHYDSQIRVLVDKSGSRMDGEWTRRLGKDRWSHLPFHAVAGDGPRFAPVDLAPLAPLPARWNVLFENGNSPAVFLLETQTDATVGGTFLRMTGDNRYLSGRRDGDRLRLSRFDGAHAFLVDARVAAGPTLEGEFWEADFPHQFWSARPDVEASLPDPFGVLSWSGPIDLAALSLADTEGKSRSLSEPEFSGNGLVVEIFGTWCPNCQDSSVFLNDLQDRYGDRGLRVVGIAFEMTDDFERNAEQVDLYREHYRLDYPMLLTTGETRSPSTLFPMIEGEFGYPSLLFLRPDGSIFRTHTGFASPAAGEDHVKLLDELESTAEQLLSEASP